MPDGPQQGSFGAVESETPYQPPAADPGDKLVPEGSACRACGSLNTSRPTVLKRRMGALQFLLFGWLALLIHTAFSKRIDRCADCGAECRYRTVASWMAMALLILIVVSMAAGIIDDFVQ
ncbi:hypothetical protein Hsar01_00156 [Haloferula sargassicola]|uniref:LITAF domain-containing protein n=1 Tax=Haloferula sargassicola TaxID=490096 RepID=A0ABP9UJR9_9BACT